MYDVFISHSHKDKLISDAICSQLETNGLKCWIAPRDIDPGEIWSDAISKGLVSCKFMVVVFSANSNQSTQVLREIELAAKHGVIVLPFRIEDTKPTGGMKYFLSTTHWIDAIDDETDQNIKLLIERIEGYEQGSIDTGVRLRDRLKRVRYGWVLLVVLICVSFSLSYFMGVMKVMAEDLDELRAKEEWLEDVLNQTLAENLRRDEEDLRAEEERLRKLEEEEEAKKLAEEQAIEAAKIMVPDVMGMTYDELLLALDSIGLDFRVKYVVDEADTAGKVISASRIGLKVKSWYVVDVKISVGDGTEAVVFEDWLLSSKVRELIDKPSGKITRGDLLNIKELNLDYTWDLTSIEGVQHMKNLERLDLGKTRHCRSYDQVFELTELNLLGLTSENPIIDNEMVKKVAGLRNLETLYLHSRKVSDISPLVTLNHLSSLWVGQCSISEIYYFYQFDRVRELGIHGNYIDDYSPLLDMPKLEIVQYEWIEGGSVKQTIDDLREMVGE